MRSVDDALADRRLHGAGHARAVCDSLDAGGGDLAVAVAVVVRAVVVGDVSPAGGFDGDEALAVAGLISDLWAHEGPQRAVAASLAACALNRRGRALAGGLLAAAEQEQVAAGAARPAEQLGALLVTPLGDRLMPTLERRWNALAGWAALAGGQRALHRMLRASGNDQAVAAVCLAVLGEDRPVPGATGRADARRLLRMIDDGRLDEVLAEAQRRLAR